MLRPVNSTGNCEPDQDSLLVKILENSAEKQRTSRRFAATDAARHASTIARKILGDGIDLCDPIHPDLDDQDRESNDSFFEDLPESLDYNASDSPLESEDEGASLESCTSKFEFSSPEVQVLTKLGGYVVTRLKRQGKLHCTGISKILYSLNFQNNTFIVIKFFFLGCVDLLLFNNNQRSPKSILLKEMQFQHSEALKDARPTLLMWLQHAESSVREIVAHTMHVPHIGRRLKEAILETAPKLACCHPDDAAVAVVNLYLRVRLHHQAALCRQKLRLGRNKRREEKKLLKITGV